MLDLLRPPPHRGPLIAAGAVLVATAVALLQIRYDGEWSDGALLLAVAAPALLFFALGIQAKPEGGHPPAFQSVLLVSALALAAISLLRLAEVLGSDDTTSPGTLTWVLLAFGGLALWPGIAKASAICAFIAALAFAGALNTSWEWIFDPDGATPFRWLLLVIALSYVVVSLMLRNSAPRHSEQMINAAGLMILVIAATAGFSFFFLGEFGALPGFWEGVILVAAVSLLAYAAADRAPGPGYLGVVNLAAFVGLVSGEEPTLQWWPLTLLALGLVALFAGLRPRSPLPPEPDAYPASATPLAARSEPDVTIKVRDES